MRQKISINNNYCHEMSQAIFTDSEGLEHVYGGGVCFLEELGAVYNFDLDTLLDNSAAMAEFVKLAGTLKNEPQMPEYPAACRLSAKYLNLLRGIAQIVSFHELLADKMTFHPYVEAVMRLEQDDHANLIFHQHYFSIKSRKGIVVDATTYSTLRKLIDDYLKIINTKTIKSKIDNIQKGVRKNTAAIVQHFNSLIKNHASLLVIRLDLSYEAKLKNVERMAHISRDQIVEDKKQFLKVVEKQFPDWLGYVLKLEFAPKKGYHYHAILYFNGNTIRLDGPISLALSHLWRSVTKERKGVTFLCNLHKEDYVHLAIGTIRHYEKEKIQNFRHIAQYLAKNDLFSTMRKNGKRTLEKSQVKLRKAKRGRPRSTG